MIRIESILRIIQKQSQLKQLKVGNLEFNLDTLSVTREDKLIKLKPAELKLLQKLMQESPNVVRKETLENILWGDDLPNRDIFKAHIYLLRKNIDKPFKRKMLKTIHGIGYQLVG
ncbi:MAG: winged helix-turn-helix domain-containing protein [gamma proteobacterium symbiont of Bathyaustriella thionipta]|nr:winged helix-turn-helix domain-containing protein [gamma proteobacterium symbiont of Bathyaustriella thionipta]MCU7951506.1 winged helix-turn-helix domain-containing protein [gamma proteobacterium symbiont of Bathyaustriella thionipta]MCU7953915.1 winged helix-turn-helix domain-containing protein [gamma proteobacterium symbiont of Bathyaustriella thionipta]